MNVKRLRFLLVVVVVFALNCALRAEVRLAAPFSDNLVLQQGQPVPVWGWADEGERITVQFRGQKVTTTAKDLKWCAVLRPLKAGGPDTLTITTKAKTIQLANVLVGEVWVCSGQSNMEFPLKNAFEAAGDLAAATNSQIRLFKVPHNRQESPTEVIKSAWETLSPQSAEYFSAVGYYFGRELQKARKVPVGLIGTYWGGSPAEVWMSRPALECNARYQAELLDPNAATIKTWRQQMDAYEKAKANAEKDGKAFTTKPPRQPWSACELYNGMVCPLFPYAIKGAIWYQGEANAPRAEQYRSLYPDMIRCWRRSWGQPDFPFICVQLAPYKAIKAEPGESDWAELREAQLLSTKVLPNAGMAVITDVGEEKDIHPRKKAPVGERLALAARAIAYGEKIEYSGPLYKSMTVKGDKAVLSFTHVGRGLEARDGAPKGFAICGDDHKWVWAKAEIQPNNTIVVSSPEVAKPVAVRYGWADYPVVNLWNKDGLPASPFRTDDFPLTTAKQ
jgi:sialate O-acetylesterase